MRKETTPQTPSERNLGFFEKGGFTTTIYVGNLLFTKKELDIKRLFKKFGMVTYVRLILDAKTNQSKGIAFIQMPNKQEAESAIKNLNGQQLDGRTLKVSIAIENEEETKVKRRFIAKPQEETPIKKPIQKRKKKAGLNVLFNYLDNK